MAQVVIVHGWSDSSKSFEPLVDFLQTQGIDVTSIYLGDYISLADDVRVEDVAKRMHAVLNERLEGGGLKAPFDMIVHSTGGLIARQWLAEYYPAGGSPARRLIMLAPANHGSPLAAKGKSMVGRIAKGWNNWFETGAQMLNALELASPYQWSLVRRDLLARNEGADSPYGKASGKVLPFVITGTHPYAAGARKLVDENGGDGTVRVPAANMNTRGRTIDFARGSGRVEITDWHHRHDFQLIPFAVLPDRNHATVVDPTKSSAALNPTDHERLGELILSALKVDENGYDALAERWYQLSEETARLAANKDARQSYFGHDCPAEYFHQYMQVIVRAIDDSGNDVADYFIEFSDGSGGDDRKAAEFFHTEVLESVKRNSNNAAYRCFFVDRTDLVNRYYPMIDADADADTRAGADTAAGSDTDAEVIAAADERRLLMTITAAPPGSNVAYFGGTTHSAEVAVSVHRETEGQQRWFRRNQTHYVEIIIPRMPRDEVFRLRQNDEPFTDV